MWWLLWGLYAGFIFRFSCGSYLALNVEREREKMYRDHQDAMVPLETRPKLEDTFLVFLLPSIFSLGFFFCFENTQLTILKTAISHLLWSI